MEECDHPHKPVNLQPSERASFLSRLFFCWALPIFFRNYPKIIVEEYYAPLKSHQSAFLGDKLENAWTREIRTSINPKLWRAIGKTFHMEFIALCILFIFSEFVLKLSQPWLIGKLISSHYSNMKESSTEKWYLYGCLLILSNFVTVTIVHFYQLKIQHLGMKIRISCCSLIYRKILTMKKNTAAESKIGNTINLISNDVNRFDLATMHILQLFVAPVHATFTVYCMYATVGPTAIAGIMLLLLFMITQIFLGKLTASYRRGSAAKTDRRIKLMDEILNGIQIVKMFTWENLFIKMVDNARKEEMDQIKKSSFIKAFNVSTMLFINRTGIFLCIFSQALIENEVSAEYVFVVSSFYAILRQTITVYFPFGLQNFSETKVSLQRIHNFLITDETTQEIVLDKEEEIMHLMKAPDELKDDRSIGVDLHNVSVKWLPSSPDYTIKKLNLHLSPSEMIVITGPVGSGKSTLLYTVLSELPIAEGTLSVVGAISYASQEPWIFSGTVRQNILFGSKFDSQKYKKVVKICQLEDDFSSLVNGDHAMVGERGSLLSGGQKSRVSLARALYKDADIYLLDDPLAAVDIKVGEKILRECILQYLGKKCRILVTHHSSYLINAASKIYKLDKGILTNDVSHKQIDPFKNENCSEKQTEFPINNFRKSKDIPVEKKPDLKSKEIYQQYAKAGGQFYTIILLLLLFVLTQIAASGADFFVAYWSNLNQPADAKNSCNTCLVVYFLIILAIIILSLVRSVIFFLCCKRASTTLHNNIFTRIIKAPMSFFKITSTGSILNRFSKDIGLIDENLPFLLIVTLQVIFIALGSIFLVSIVNPWMLVPTIAISIFFYQFKTRFLARSRNMKRLEAEARSPLYSHVHTTIQGLTTIRTFNVQNLLKNDFDHYQDLLSSASYTFLTCNRAFGFWLDMSTAFYATVVIMIVMLIDTSAGNVGLSITQSMNLIGVLQWGIRQWSEVENQVIHVERVLEYARVSQEKDSKEQNISNWPNKGEIKFQSVSLKYADTNRLSLNNINLEIKSEEKIGIVGRTGAGKSSLISTLFRLVDFKGKILIDDIDIQNVSLVNLRSRISIIPQEPILFAASLRDNIDPFREFDDNVLWTVLEDVEMKNVISELDCKISKGGANFSVGQRQLICLARAILKKNKIIVMDEATANIDSETARLIQNTIERKCKNCTILTVAHRLNFVMESDKIITMDDGKITEFDHPYRLLQNSQSLYAQLVKESKTKK